MEATDVEEKDIREKRFWAVRNEKLEKEFAKMPRELMTTLLDLPEFQRASAIAVVNGDDRDVSFVRNGRVHEFSNHKGQGPTISVTDEGVTPYHVSERPLLERPRTQPYYVPTGNEREKVTDEYDFRLGETIIKGEVHVGRDALRDMKAFVASLKPSPVAPAK